MSIYSKPIGVLLFLLSFGYHGIAEAHRRRAFEEKTFHRWTGHDSFTVKSAIHSPSDTMNILTQRSYFKSRTDEVSKQDKEPLILEASSRPTAQLPTSRNLLLSALDVVLDDDNADDYLYRKRPLPFSSSSSTNPNSSGSSSSSTTLMQSLELEIPRGGATPNPMGDASKLKPLTGAAIHGPILGLLYKLSGWIAESSTRCWTTLMISIFVEIAATTMTKQASDSGSAARMALAMSMYVASLLGFAASLPKIDVSIAYAVWSALGTAFVSAAGILLFGEKCDRLKIASILMIVAGVVGLNMSEDGGHH